MTAQESGNEQGVARREVLRLGGLAGLSLSLPQLLASRASGAQGGGFGAAKQVIMLYLHGGHPQQETFDPKPDGPSDVRGEFNAIATRVPGVRFCELLPRCAQLADKMSVIRSMSHNESNHVHASLSANTGRRQPDNAPKGDFPPSDNDFPPFGAVIDWLSPAGVSLPNWVRIGPLMRRSNGTVLHGQTPGFLGKQHSSFAIDQPLRGDDVELKSLQPTQGLTSLRMTRRKQLRDEFQQHRRIIDAAGETAALDAAYQRALNLLSSTKAQQAFDIAQEPSKVRERYGATEFGQRCLLARRLAEAGVPMINVSYCHTPSGSWDTHSQNFKQLKASLAPTLDAAFSALIEDLEQRGRLDDTLVVVTAEFGRTPKINSRAGRDHWPNVYSIALAGAGVRKGYVHGASDASAAFPADDPIAPADLAATLYHLLGVKDDTTVYDHSGRPHRVIGGRRIADILA